MDIVFGEKISGVKYHDREGSYLIAIKDNLLASVKTPKGYFLLGGGIEKNESHIDCIKRECIEEIGYDVNIKNYICSAEIYSTHERIGYFHPIQYYYYGEILNKIRKPIEPDHKFEWITLDNIEDKMYVESQAWAVRQCLMQAR
jgi:8-oxo-dGTP diphosphatase